MIPRMWIGMTAAEARAEGLTVDATIPDHALLGPSELLGEDRATVDRDNSNGMLLNVSFPLRFEWRWLRAAV